MAYLSYTRNREDVMLMRAFRGIDRGFYIDVGAFEPIKDSNTFALYLKGWRGVAIEPQSRVQDLWRRVRPEDVFVPAAAGAVDGRGDFFECDREQNSTSHHETAVMLGLEGRPFSRREVTIASLTTVLATHRPEGEIHLLSVDVEGAEHDVLQGLDLVRFRPWVVVVEATLPNRPKRSSWRWEPLLTERGYDCVYFDGVNRFYVSEEHGDLASHFDHPACVWDDFVDYRLAEAKDALALANYEIAALRAAIRDCADAG